MRKCDIQYVENRMNELFVNKIKITLKQEAKENQIVTLQIDKKKYMFYIKKSIVSYGMLIDIFRNKICEVLANGRN